MEYPSIFDESIEFQSDQLAKKCHVIKAIIKDKGYLNIRPKSDHFHSLCEAIASQQLSTKAAQTIFGRFSVLLDHDVTPSNVLSSPEESLRSCGLSGSKVKYLKDLALHFHEDKGAYETLEYHSDDEIITRLTQIKGIGKWSAQMFLIFSLGRVDVYPEDDLGIRNATKMHFPETDQYKPKEFLLFSERWEPQRTLASLYLWKSLG